MSGNSHFIKNCRGCGRDTTSKSGYCRVCMGGAIPEPEEAVTGDQQDMDQRETVQKLAEGDE